MSMMFSELANRTGLPVKYLRTLIKKKGGRTAKDGRVILEDPFVDSILRRYPKKTTIRMALNHRLLSAKLAQGSLSREESMTLKKLNIIFGHGTSPTPLVDDGRHRGPMYEIAPRIGGVVVGAGHPGLGKKS
jgi:hypothetical protein